MTEAAWTRSKGVTKEGWYWWRDVDKRGKVRFCVCQEVYMLHGSLFAADCGYLDKLSGEWLGPITPTDRQQGKVEGIQESKNLVSEFIEAWLLAGMVAKLLTPAVHEAVGGLSRDLRRELQKIEQAAQDEKGVGDGKDCL